MECMQGPLPEAQVCKAQVPLPPLLAKHQAAHWGHSQPAGERTARGLGDEVWTGQVGAKRRHVAAGGWARAGTDRGVVTQRTGSAWPRCACAGSLLWAHAVSGPRTFGPGRLPRRRRRQLPGPASRGIPVSASCTGAGDWRSG